MYDNVQWWLQTTVNHSVSKEPVLCSGLSVRLVLERCRPNVQLAIKLSLDDLRLVTVAERGRVVIADINFMSFFMRLMDCVLCLLNFSLRFAWYRFQEGSEVDWSCSRCRTYCVWGEWSWALYLTPVKFGLKCKAFSLPQWKQNRQPLLS